MRLDLADTAVTRSGLSLIQLHDGLWRICRSTGDVLGYVESERTPGGDRFRAKRYLPTQRRFSPVGEFWRFEDAVSCFRF
ncbi:hypothetical protein CLV46_1454 [Diaminobutyricimonas aerilata]|uniref:DNA mismatch repair protein n=1 Tax=Diaminobutyricimonas aerilata TaxID=1162967 RepID=A0A2M9CJ51_9MICO|nr:hypothetical protein [Diaminobutyricimonas aerilata]PJJ71898.1 hypothetical protein CLV46_1454 [Diaminobutyricimonas aerilata]